MLRKILVASVFAVALSVPAHAAHRTIVELEFDDGKRQKIDFDGFGIAHTAGIQRSYVFEATEDSSSVCFDTNDSSQDCIHFDQLAQAVGDQVRFSTSAGEQGVATIILLEDVYR